MNGKLLASFATIAGIVLASQQSVLAQGNLNDTRYGGGYYTGTGQGYYGGYGQGYGSYGSGYSSEYAAGHPTLSQQTYEPTRNDILPNRSNNNSYNNTPNAGFVNPYNSYGTGRYGDLANPLMQNPNYSGYGFGYGGAAGPGIYYGTMHQRIDGFGGSGDHYFRKGSPYSRF